MQGSNDPNKPNRQNNPLMNKGIEFLAKQSPKKRKIYVMALLIVVIAGVIVWSFISMNIRGKLRDQGLDVSGGTIRVNEDRVWPMTMPADVPKIDDGQIWSTSSQLALWNVSIREFPDGGADVFLGRLEDAGWTITGDVRNDANTTVHGYAEKGDLLLEFMNNQDVDSFKLMVERKLF